MKLLKKFLICILFCLHKTERLAGMELTVLEDPSSTEANNSDARIAHDYQDASAEQIQLKLPSFPLAESRNRVFEAGMSIVRSMSDGTEPIVFDGTTNCILKDQRFNELMRCALEPDERAIAFFLIQMSPLQPIPVGLENCDNSCFMNAALQCLNSMADLSNLLLTKHDCYNQESICSTYLHLLRDISGTMTVKFITPTEFSQQGWVMLEKLQNTQQDADEFLVGLLDRLMDNDLALTPKGRASKLELASLLESHENSQFVSDDYVGEKKTESTSVVRLAMDADDGDLASCLNRYFEGESDVELTFETSKIKGTKKLSLKRTSQYIIFAIKRNKFVVNEETNEPFYEKNTHYLPFPLQDLDLESYFEEDSKDDSLYDLVGVVMHRGCAGKGHYISYVKRNNNWFKCNDEEVLEESEMNEIASKRGDAGENGFVPTLFFYERSNIHRARLKQLTELQSAHPTWFAMIFKKSEDERRFILASSVANSANPSLNEPLINHPDALRIMRKLKPSSKSFFNTTRVMGVIIAIALVAIVGIVKKQLRKKPDSRTRASSDAIITPVNEVNLSVVAYGYEAAA